MSKDDKVKFGGLGSAFGAYVKPKLAKPSHASAAMDVDSSVASPDATPNTGLSGHKRKFEKISK